LTVWIDELIEAAVEREEHPLARSLAEIDRRLIRSWLDGYLGQHAKYEESYEGVDAGSVRPTYFEVSFGTKTTAVDGISTPEPLALGKGDERIRVTGRIDRLDLGSAGGKPIFGLVDYKSGSAKGYTEKHVLEGRALQLTLYSVAAQELLLRDRGAVPWQFGYWFVKENGFKSTLTLHEATKSGLREASTWTELRERVVAQVLSLVRGARRGEFPPMNDDEHCTSHCDFRTVCRVGQARALEKTWQPPSPS
jgi:hypothetical protein